MTRLVLLTHGHLDALGFHDEESRKSYFSDKSIAYCLLDNGRPVLAGGIVNFGWNRGEAWLLPTPWFYTHPKTCLKYAKEVLPMMARRGKFKRVQATCATSISPSLFRHLGFYSEGILNAFGPNGEACFMYARIF